MSVWCCSRSTHPPPACCCSSSPSLQTHARPARHAAAFRPAADGPPPCTAGPAPATAGMTRCGTARCGTSATPTSWERPSPPGSSRAACRSGAGQGRAGRGARQLPSRICRVRIVQDAHPSTHPPTRIPRSYAIAIGYVLFDTYDKWQKTLGDARAKLGSRPGIPPSVDLDRRAPGRRLPAPLKARRVPAMRDASPASMCPWPAPR